MSEIEKGNILAIAIVSILNLVFLAYSIYSKSQNLIFVSIVCIVSSIYFTWKEIKKK